MVATVTILNRAKFTKKFVFEKSREFSVQLLCASLLMSGSPSHGTFNSQLIPPDTESHDVTRPANISFQKCFMTDFWYQYYIRFLDIKWNDKEFLKKNCLICLIYLQGVEMMKWVMIKWNEKCLAGPRLNSSTLNWLFNKSRLEQTKHLRTPRAHYWHLWGESTNQRRMPWQRASNAEMCHGVP